MMLKLSSSFKRVDEALVVVGLGELVQLGALLARDKPGDAELLAGLLHRLHPLGEAAGFEALLAGGEHLLRHDLSGLGLGELGFGEASLGVGLGAVPDLAVAAGHGLFGDLLGLAGHALGRLGGARLGGFTGNSF